MTIRLFEPRFDSDACIEQLRECFDRGWTSLGFKTDEFEASWMQYTGYRHAFFVNSCTAALYLALSCLREAHGWSDGDEIISTPNTFVSTNHMILKNGLKPVFADIDDTLCLNPQSVVEHITPRTRAVMFVGVGGNAGHWGRIVKICQEHGLRLILDAAHMSGTRIDGRIVGQEADVVCNSFQAVKNLPTGDSGMVCFNDGDCDNKARSLAWLGIDKNTYDRRNDGKNGSYRWSYSVDDVGDKLHGNSVMAAIAIAQLPHLEEGNLRRRAIARTYDTILDKVSPSRLVTPTIPDGCTPSRHLYQILVEDRDALHDALLDRDIECGVHYVANTRYPMYAYAAGSCPRAEYVSDHVLSLPMHLRLEDDDAATIAHAVVDALS